MSHSKVKDFSASIHARLLKRSRENKEDFQFLLQRYAAERFLYRLGQSPYREQFVLKGAMLFAIWGGSGYRATRDIDFTGYGDSDADGIKKTFQNICKISVNEDGLAFDESTMKLESIRDAAEYDGLRITFEAHLGSARIKMQVDIGFGNAVEPPAKDVEYPILLPNPIPYIRAYSQEAVIAEKFHAVVHLGETNSRLKDFYDLYSLSEQFSFDGEKLSKALEATFARRNTALPASLPVGLSTRFYSDSERAQRWRAYLKKNNLPGCPADFDAVGIRLREFIEPVVTAITDGAKFASFWQSSKGWGVKNLDKGDKKSDIERLDYTSGARVFAINPDSASNLPKKELSIFKCYPDYTKANVEWLNKMPVHWSVRRLKTISCVSLSNVDKKSVEGEETVRLCNYTDVYYNEKINSLLDFMPATASFNQIRQFSLLAGDVLITKDSESWKDIAVPSVVAEDLPGVLCGYHLAHIRPNELCHGPFLARLFGSVGPRDQFQISSNGITRFGLGGDAIGTALFPIPPISEQRAIAKFLDRMTLKIDELISRKEKLIELLLEKRSALISKTVTNGLGRNERLKDSGIEWLGEVPESWVVKRLGYICMKIGSGKTPLGGATTYLHQGVLFLRSQNVYDEGLYQQDSVYISEEVDAEMIASRVKPKDILLNITGASLGRTCIVPNEMPAANVNQHVCIIRLCDSRQSEYMAWVMKSASIKSQIEVAQTGAARDGLTSDQISKLVFVLPDAGSQAIIAKFLHQETGRIDKLVDKIQIAVEHLQEYRLALISAAVTGKIDVREVAA